MFIKTAKIWSIGLITVLLFFISFYFSHVFLQSYTGSGKLSVSRKTVCDSWMMSNKWEALGFNVTRNEQLFLRLGDFFWKDYTSSLPLPYGIKGSEVYLLKVLAIVASYEMPDSIKSLPCRTCVVIGNGFSIKNSSLGGAINKYDVVIRLNDAPVRGYEDDVGNKTTMRFFYPESASYNPSIHNDPDTIMVLVPFKQQDLRWIKEILYDEKRERKGFWRPPPQFWLGKPSQIRILDPIFLHQTASRLLKIPLKPKSNQYLYVAGQSGKVPPIGTCVARIPDLRSVHPTTGILAIYVALNFCDMVHIAGFGYPDSKNHKHPIHYYGYDTLKSMKDSYHDLGHEAEALKRLEDSGAIVFLNHPS